MKLLMLPEKMLSAGLSLLIYIAILIVLMLALDVALCLLTWLEVAQVFFISWVLNSFLALSGLAFSDKK